MGEISIGEAVMAGFELIAKKPLSVLTWGLVRVVYSAGVLALYAPLLILSMQQAQLGDTSSQAFSQQLASRMMTFNGLSTLLNFVGIFISALVACAVMRAVIHPEKRGFAYLRVSSAEFFFAVLAFVAALALVFGIFVSAIPFIIGAVILASMHLIGPMVGLIVLGLIVLIVGLIYLGIRFAFVGPMVVDDGEFHLFDAWSLTKGHVGSLFVIGLFLLLVALGAQLLLALVFITFIFVALGVAAGGFTEAGMTALFAQPPAAIFGHFAPWFVVYAILAVAIEGCALAIFVAPWARAYRDVRGGGSTVYAAPVQPAPVPT